MKYGCGSCGPRGFYGTIDVHLELEKKFSEFLNVDGAILYSDGSSTCASTVAAFAKRGDLIIADEAIHEPLVAGVMLSRATVKWFKHNDMDDLKKVLENVRQTDQKLRRKSNSQRRFIVAEGLYKNTGKVVPLDKLVQLKHEYCCRMILDESHSFGTLGQTGRGVMELYNLKPMYDVDIITIALENAMGSVGGITVGCEEVIEHQRLSGSGYCFSASSPPFTASAAMQSLMQLKTYGSDVLLKRLHDNKSYMRDKLMECIVNKFKTTKMTTTIETTPVAAPTKKSIDEKDEEDISDANSCNLFVLESDERSPIIYLMLEEEVQQQLKEQQQKQLRELKKSLLEKPMDNNNMIKKRKGSGSNKQQQQLGSGRSVASSITSANSTAALTSLETESIQPPTTTVGGPIIENDFVFHCNVMRNCLHNGIAFVATGRNFGSVRAEPPPAIRIIMSAVQTKGDIDQAVQVLSESIQKQIAELTER